LFAIRIIMAYGEIVPLRRCYFTIQIFIEISYLHETEYMNEIEVIWKFLDNLDEYVYATDIETDELVYMNRKLLEVYGLQSIDDVKGMKCYEVLQKSSVPCGMCNNDRLCAGKFVEWRYYNPVIDKYMMLKDTLVEDPVTNKKYRIEISIDISEERSQDKMIQKYRDMESFVNEALKDALSVESPDETIRIILEYLGKVLNGERTYIFEKNRDGRDDNTYEWTAPGVPPEIDNLQNLPPEICENWYHIFEEGKYVQIPDIEEMRLSDPFQYENLKRQKIQFMMRKKSLLFTELTIRRHFHWNIRRICFRSWVLFSSPASDAGI